MITPFVEFPLVIEINFWRCARFYATQTSPVLRIPKLNSLSGAKTIKKNTNSTQNKSQTHRAKQYEVQNLQLYLLSTPLPFLQISNLHRICCCCGRLAFRTTRTVMGSLLTSPPTPPNQSQQSSSIRAGQWF